MNITIQNYLKDTSIPKEKRSNAYNDLNSGINESAIENRIKQIYGDKYSTSDLSSSISDTTGKSFLQKGIEGVKSGYSDLGNRISGGAKTAIDTAKSGFNFARSGAEDVIGAVTGDPTIDPRTGETKQTPQDALSRIGQAGEGIAKTIAGATETVFSPVAGAIGLMKPEIESGAKKVWSGVPEENKQVALKLLKDLDENTTGQEKDAIRSLVDMLGLQTAKSLAPSVKSTITKGIDKANESIIPTAKTVATNISDVSDDLLKAARNNIQNKSLAKAEKAISEGIEKGIRPSLTGEKSTIKGLDSWKTKARSAINTIIENKENLNYVDDLGESSVGTPKNLKQFSDAIDQTKKKIYNQYNSLAKQTGIDHKLQLNDIGQELNILANNKVLKTEKPEIVNYALEKINRYAGQTYKPEQAQEAIKILNQSLESFYKNPSYDTASKAYVDSLVVNNLRKNLDDLIEKATGKEYQALKNQYSSLKAIEKDVVHRALVDARKNNKGLLDFTDIFSGGEALAGIMSLNPSLLAKAATQKGIKEWYKYLNDPNVIIKNMFNKAEKVYGKTAQPVVIPEIVKNKKGSAMMPTQALADKLPQRLRSLSVGDEILVNNEKATVLGSSNAGLRVKFASDGSVDNVINFDRVVKAK